MFKEMYLLLDLYNYTEGAFHFHFYINIFVLLLGVAMCACTFIATAFMRKTSAVYVQLLRNKAFDEQSAKTVEELNIKPGVIIKSTLMRGNHFNKCIRRVGAKIDKNTPVSMQKIDFATEKFYIDTSVKFKNPVPPSYVSAVIISAIIALFTIILFLLMPDILELLIVINSL